MAFSSLTQFDYALKERYVAREVERLTLENRPLFAWFPKDPDFQGDVEPVPVTYGSGQGLGKRFSVAQANQSNVKGKKFNITVGDYFAFVSIGDKALKASRGNVGAFLKNKEIEISSMYNEFANDIHLLLWGDGGQSRGQVSSGYSSGNTITLADANDINNIEEGMVLEASADDGSSSGDVARAGTMTVETVNRNAGSFTVDDATGITGLAASDYLFRAGSVGGGDYTESVAGLEAWIPASSPSSTSFFGVDRTADDLRLGGVRVSSPSGNIEERLRTLATRISVRGEGNPTEGWMHPTQWQKLATAMEAKRIRSEKTMLGQFGFDTLRVVSGVGSFEVFGDPRCPTNTAFLLDKSTWSLKSMFGIPHVLNEDGFEMLRAPSSAGYEFRLVAYPQVCCNAPGRNGRIALSAS